MYATFGCKTYREQCEQLRETFLESEEPLGDDCAVGFADLVPPLFIDLPACPGCGGPSEVLELLVPVAG